MGGKRNGDFECAAKGTTEMKPGSSSTCTRTTGQAPERRAKDAAALFECHRRLHRILRLFLPDFEPGELAEPAPDVIVLTSMSSEEALQPMAVEVSSDR